MNKTPKTNTVNFILKGYALGDYVCFMSALKWIADTQPHVHGVIWVPEYFGTIAHHIFEKCSTWKVRDLKGIKPLHYQNTPTFIPDTKNTPINAAGAHLVDLGFILFANRAKAPDSHQNYVQLDLIKNKMEDRYAVMTPGWTNELRAMPPSLFDIIKKHLISKGLKVFLLGKEEMTPLHKANFGGYDFSGCVNLINQTSVMDAAKIINDASVVIGIDNGLLHLAGMTETPVVFGYTVASPEHRRIRRPSGRVHDVVVPKYLVQCIHCQSELRYVFDHDYRTCFQGDKACLKHHAYKSMEWLHKIDMALMI